MGTALNAPLKRTKAENFKKQVVFFTDGSGRHEAALFSQIKNQIG
jgi:hypothetical protein